MSVKKKLTRDVDNQLIAGVIAGLANYFEQDITLWRLGAALLLVATGGFPGIILYILAWIIMPTERYADTVSYTVDE